ncbi:MAG: DUF1640 domain-containing protein [Candidatus Tectomicrobia bacterium]|uniref:DUF1640 domain-containing protein n=1 Tax=Tectimicrobiota bacterium TaxID=2528274 RepID=A0A932CMK2_UNCTE|nr:DUF1640 domain-containing protein [Candidatus Tectomicrobia bacterium]
MAVLTFDTHAFIKQLEEAGFPEAQAEALSEAFKKAQEAHLGELATRHDLRELELKIEAELRLLKWMMGIMLAGVVSLVLKAFF